VSEYEYQDVFMLKMIVPYLFRYLIYLFRFAIASRVSRGAILLFCFLFVLFLYWYGTCGSQYLEYFLVIFQTLRKFQGINLMMLDYTRIYGEIFATSLGRKPSIVVADPEVLSNRPW